MDNSKNLAEKYFDSLIQTELLENEIEEYFESIGIPNEGYEKITYDYYDYSFEFKECESGFDFNEEQLLKLWELGFLRCWICYKDGTEKYYKYYG